MEDQDDIIEQAIAQGAPVTLHTINAFGELVSTPVIKEEAAA